MKKLIVLLIAITLMGVFLSSCSEDEKTTTPNENPEDYLFQGMSIVQTGNSDFEYIANDTEGNMVLFDTINGVVRKAVCRSAEGEWAEMQFDSNGLPVSVYSEDHVIFIGNIDDGKADFSIYEIATGSTTIYRDVTFNITKMTKGWYGDISYALEVASSALWAFNTACFTIGLAGPHAGVSVALGTVGIILAVLADVGSDYYADLEASSLAFSIGADAIGCGTGGYSDCISLGVTITDTALDLYYDNQGGIDSAEQLLYTGTGDVQVTLTWTNTSDLDLHVIDPYGEEIYFGNQYSSSGGILDYDDTSGYGPENIYWPEGTAPNGTYQVYLDYYSGTTSASYEINIYAFGQNKKFSGTIGIDQTYHITDFNSDGVFFKSKNEMPDTTLWKKK